MMNEEQGVVMFESENGEIGLHVELKDDTVWLSQKQIAELFDKNRTVITRHINNILKDTEVDEKSNVQKMHFAHSDKPIKYYSLDIVLSVGYRVNSKKAIEFRIWATNILKEHLIKGYSVNKNRLKQKGLDELNKTMELLRTTIEQSEIGLDEAKGMLDIIINYSRTWSLLQGYDEDDLPEYRLKSDQNFILDFDEAKTATNALGHLCSSSF